MITILVSIALILVSSLFTLTSNGKRIEFFTLTEQMVVSFAVTSLLLSTLLVFLMTIYLLDTSQENKGDKTTHAPLFTQDRGVIMVFAPLVVAIILDSLGFDTNNMNPYSLVNIIGIAVILSSIHRGGLFMFQGDALKKLISSQTQEYQFTDIHSIILEERRTSRELKGISYFLEHPSQSVLLWENLQE